MVLRLFVSANIKALTAASTSISGIVAGNSEIVESTVALEVADVATTPSVSLTVT